jgi:hypothetical protein
MTGTDATLVATGVVVIVAITARAPHDFFRRNGLLTFLVLLVAFLAAPVVFLIALLVAFLPVCTGLGLRGHQARLRPRRAVDRPPAVGGGGARGGTSLTLGTNRVTRGAGDSPRVSASEPSKRWIGSGSDRENKNGPTTRRW